MNHIIDIIIKIFNDAGRVFCDFSLNMFIQASVLIVVLFIIDILIRKRVRATFRYCIWMLVFIKLILPPVFSLPTGIGNLFGDYFVVNSASIDKPFQSIDAENVLSAESLDTEITWVDEFSPQQARQFRDYNRTITPPVSISPEISNVPQVSESEQIILPVEQVVLQRSSLTWQGGIFIIWLVGVLILSVLLVQRIFFVKVLIAQSEPAKNRLIETLDECRKQLGIKRNIRMKLSYNASSPAVCGLFKPVILIPTNILSKISHDKLKAILIHELSHIKRADLLVNCVQTFLQILYFYNPLLWFANSIVRKVREQAVDEMVLVALGADFGELSRAEVESYTNTLIDVAEMAFSRPALSLRLVGVVESKKALSERIKHILGRPFPKSAKLGVMGLLIVLIAAFVLLPMGKAQHSGQDIPYEDCLSVYEFDGIHDYLEIPDNKALDIGRSFTAECWIKAESASGEDSIFSKEIPWQSGWTLILNSGGIQETKYDEIEPQELYSLTFAIGNGEGFTNMTSKPIINRNDWHHIAATFDNGSGAIFVDGRLICSKVLPFGENASIPLRIGKGSKELGRHFKGKLADLRIWNTARSLKEIQQNMFRKLSGNEEGLIANWNLKPDSNNEIQDISTNKFNAKFYNSDNTENAEENLNINTPEIEPLPSSQISEMFKRIMNDEAIDLNLIYQSLIGPQTALRAEAARYLGTHGNSNSIPYLINALSDESSHVGGRYPDMGMHTTRYWANDSLKKLTGQDFGFVWDDPVEKRNEAIQRWQTWWKENNNNKQLFSATLSNGVTVELLGICDYPSDDKQWWKPDGSYIEGEGFGSYRYKNTSEFPDENEISRVFAFNLEAEDLSDLHISWEIDSLRSSFFSDYQNKENKELKPIQAIIAKFEKDDKSKVLTIRVASGKWNFAAQVPGEVNTYTTLDSITNRTVIFDEADYKNNQLRLTATHLLGKDYDCRIVCYDKQDNLHEPVKCSNAGGEMRLCEGYFDNISLDQIKSVSLQARKYESVTFENISLHPAMSLKDAIVQASGLSDSQMNFPDYIYVERREPNNTSVNQSQRMIIVQADVITIRTPNLFGSELDKYLSEEFNGQSSTGYTREQAQKIRKWISDYPNASIISSSPTIAYQGKPAEMSVLKTNEYVVDYEKDTDSASGYRPVKEVFKTGVQIQFEPELKENDVITLNLNINNSDIAEIIENTHASGGKIQLPTMNSNDIATKVSVQKGKYLLLPLGSFGKVPLLGSTPVLRDLTYLLICADVLYGTENASTARAIGNRGNNLNIDKEWGEAVEGIRCRAWSEQTSYAQGTVPKLFADIQNLGQKNLRIALEHESWEVEIDGQWYRVNSSISGERNYLPLNAGQLQENLTVWIGFNDTIGQGLYKLEPGKHTLRVARLLNSTWAPREEILRIVSNPFEIETLPRGSERRFGKVEELEVGMTGYSGSIFSKKCLIDFETGKIFSVPENLKSLSGTDESNQEKIELWCRDNGIDTLAQLKDNHPGFVDDLQKESGQFINLVSTTWDSIEPDEFFNLMNRIDDSYKNTIQATKIPETFGIKTAEGNFGLVRITGYDEHKMTIQYKMLNPLKARLYGQKLRHFVTIVAGPDKDRIGYKGQQITYEALKDEISRLPDKNNTVLSVKFEPEMYEDPNDRGVPDQEVMMKSSMLVDEFKLDYLSYAGKYDPLESMGPVSIRAINEFIPDSEINIELHSFEDKPLLNMQSIEFSKNQDNSIAKLKFTAISYPHKFWQILIRLYDEFGQYVAAAAKTYDNTGIIRTFPVTYNEVYEFDFGQKDTSKAFRFEVELREIIKTPESDKVSAIDYWSSNDEIKLGDAVRSLPSVGAEGVDFNRCQAYPWPDGDSTQDKLGWVKENGIDIVGDMENDRLGIVSGELIKVDNKLWNQSSAKGLQLAFKDSEKIPLTDYKGLSAAFIDAKAEKGNVFGFKTQEGNIGLLKIEDSWSLRDGPPQFSMLPAYIIVWYKLALSLELSQVVIQEQTLDMKDKKYLDLDSGNYVTIRGRDVTTEQLLEKGVDLCLTIDDPGGDSPFSNTTVLKSVGMNIGGLPRKIYLQYYSPDNFFFYKANLLEQKNIVTDKELNGKIVSFRTSKGKVGVMRIINTNSETCSIQYRFIPELDIPIDKYPWGEPVGGLQCRLRAVKSSWGVNEIPEFKLDLKNEGESGIGFIQVMEAHCEIEVDDKWYGWAEPMMINAPGWSLEKGEEFCGAIGIKLIDSWALPKEGNELKHLPGIDEYWGEHLKLAPGKHTIRVKFRPDEAGWNPKPDQAVLPVISNPVEIEILPEK